MIEQGGRADSVIRLFTEKDTDGSGNLDYIEFKGVMLEFMHKDPGAKNRPMDNKLSQKELRALFETFDSNGTRVHAALSATSASSCLDPHTHKIAMRLHQHGAKARLRLFHASTAPPHTYESRTLAAKLYLASPLLKESIMVRLSDASLAVLTAGDGSVSYQEFVSVVFPELDIEGLTTNELQKLARKLPTKQPSFRNSSCQVLPTLEGPSTTTCVNSAVPCSKTQVVDQVSPGLEEQILSALEAMSTRLDTIDRRMELMEHHRGLSSL